MIPQCSIDLSADKEFFKIGISLLQFPLSNHVLHCKRIYAKKSKFWKSQSKMNGSDFTLTKDHLLWHCDITTSSFTQISHRTASGAVNWRTRRSTSWCFQDSSICLSFQQTGTCAVSRQVAQRCPSETNQIIETMIIKIVQKEETGTWQMTPFSSMKSPTLRSTTVSLVAPVFPSVNSRVRR